MNGTKLYQRLAIVPIVALGLTVAGCNKQADNGTTTTPTTTANTSTTTTTGKNTTLNYSKNSPLDTTNMFTQTDLTQTVDTTTAKKITLEDGKDVTIDAAGTYVITGTAKNSTVIVNASADAEVHLVFDNASITNTNKPTVYAVNAKNVYVTTTQNSTNNLKVTGEFTEDDGKNIDAVIFAKTNITLNGLGTLNIDSSANGVASNNDLKVTGGTYNINTTKHGFKALNSIRVADGTFNINAKKDGFHSENEDDLTTGYVYIAGGNFTINSEDDGIQGTTITEIDGGTFDINAVEGIEGTYVQINDGTIKIYATDDGINASEKATNYDVQLEINGGNLDITMAEGDTDALDANGTLTINGGYINITAQSAFDYDLTGTLNGGTVIVNGTQVTTLENSMMGGPGGQPGQGGPGGFGDPQH